MTKSIFIFISSVLLIFPVVFWHGEFSIEEQLYFCIPVILILGVPHGAIDNVLYLEYRKFKLHKFIGLYLLLVFSYVVSWFYLPVFTYALFLLMSAYHFGQSQFSHYLKSSKISTKLVSFLWGTLILSGLIYLNYNDIDDAISQSAQLASLNNVNDASIMLTILLVSGAGLFTTFIYLLHIKELKTEEMLMELVVLGLIFSAFYLLPLLIGFTLYFVILHALKVMREEYFYLKKKRIVRSPGSFIKMVLPLSILSYLGMIFLFGAIYFGFISIGYGYMFLIIISSITFPHIFVMEKFYLLSGGQKKQ